MSSARHAERRRGRLLRPHRRPGPRSADVLPTTATPPAALAHVAFPAVAQQRCGSVDGRVVDNTQRPLPGVTVSLSGPAMQGSRTAVTDAEGRFRFVPVPPGENYTTRLELQGFNTVDNSGIKVPLGKEAKINAEMTVSKFAETITVAAEKIQVDTTKSTVDTDVDWKLADTLATNRNFQTMMQIAPGVVAGNNPLVNGVSNDANQYPSTAATSPTRAPRPGARRSTGTPSPRRSSRPAASRPSTAARPAESSP
jgi:hypothetical protein